MTNEAKKVGLSKEQLDDIQKIVSEIKYGEKNEKIRLK